MNNHKSTKEYMLEQKLSVIKELINLMKEYNIPEIKRLCKENKDIQLKLLNVKTEILKIEDKLEDIISLNEINNADEMKNAAAQFLNMIDEEKAAHMIIQNNPSPDSEICAENNQIDESETFMSDEEFYNRSEQYRGERNYNKNPGYAEQEIRNYDEEISKFQKEYEYVKNEWNQNLLNDEYWEKIQKQKEEAEITGEETKALLLQAKIEYRNDCINNPEKIREQEEFQKEIEEEQEQEGKQLNIKEIIQARHEFESYTGIKNIQPEDDDFNTYVELKRNGQVQFTKCRYKSENVRVYNKYVVNGLIKENPNVSFPLSKRQLPEEVFRYLISNNIIQKEDFKIFSKNQFGRTFESKMGDIILEKDLPKEANRQKRYNKLDFTKYKKSDFQGIIYVSNQWTEESIEKFVDYMNKNYKEYIEITSPAKELMKNLKKRKQLV